MIHEETQAFLDELANPTHHTPANLRAWIKASAKIIRKEGQQIALMKGLMEEVGAVEDDRAITGKVDTMTQQVDAQAKIVSEIARLARKLRVSRQDFGDLSQDLRTLAEAAGYTLP